MRGGEDTGAPIERRTEEVVCPRLHLSRIHRHPHPELPHLPPVLCLQPALTRFHRRDRVAHRGEDGGKPVAAAVEDASSRLLDAGDEDPLVSLQHPGHRLGVQFPEHRRVLHIGHEEGQRLNLGLNVEIQGGVVFQDALFEALQLRRWIDAHLLGQVETGLLVGTQRLGLSPCSVEGDHVLGPKALRQRVLGGEHLELGEHLGVPPQCQLGLDAALHRLQPQLLETAGLGLQVRHPGHIGIRVTPPQCQDLAEQFGRLCGF